MADYINRDSVIELSREYYSQGAKEKAVPVKAIRNIPPSDVVLARRARWKTESLHFKYCSLCNEPSWLMTNFCPNCGAIMNKEETDG